MNVFALISNMASKMYDMGYKDQHLSNINLDKFSMLLDRADSVAQEVGHRAMVRCGPPRGFAGDTSINIHFVLTIDTLSEAMGVTMISKRPNHVGMPMVNRISLNEALKVSQELEHAIKSGRQIHFGIAIIDGNWYTKGEGKEEIDEQFFDGLLQEFEKLNEGEDFNMALHIVDKLTPRELMIERDLRVRVEMALEENNKEKFELYSGMIAQMEEEQNT